MIVSARMDHIYTTLFESREKEQGRILKMRPCHFGLGSNPITGPG